MAFLHPRRATYISTNKLRDIKRIAVSEDKSDLCGSGEGDIPWGKGGDRSDLHKRYPGGKVSSPSSSTEVSKEMPADGDNSQGVTNRTQLEARYKKVNSSSEDWKKDYDVDLSLQIGKLLKDSTKSNNEDAKQSREVLKDLLIENNYMPDIMHQKLYEVIFSVGHYTEQRQYVNDLMIGVVDVDPVEKYLHTVGWQSGEDYLVYVEDKPISERDMAYIEPSMSEEGYAIYKWKGPTYLADQISENSFGSDGYDRGSMMFSFPVELVKEVEGTNMYSEEELDANLHEIIDIEMNLAGEENTGRVQEGKMKKTAMHLFIDNNLRGSVNYVVESEPHLSWKDIKSINYTTVPKNCIDLDAFPKSMREDNIIIYHANTNELKTQGLQNVENNDFPDNAVMVFYKTAGAGFHMNNVKFPIDIIFTDDKFSVLGTRTMYPNTTELCFPPYGSVHAIEAKKGFVHSKGIKKGDKLEIK